MRPLVFSFLFSWILLPGTLAQDSQPGGAVHPGQPSNCIGWHTIVSGDDCETVPKKYGISKSEFLAWNPAVSKDCLTNFWLKYAYCVRIDGSSAIYTTSQSTSTSGGVKEPTSTEEATATETATETASLTTGSLSESPDGTSTESIVTTAVNTTYSIREPISTWNITTPTTDVSWPPKATQPGQPKDCNKWHFVRGSQTCRDVLNKHGSFMKKQDFFKWNPEVHDDCSGLFVGYWYCVGVKSNSTLDLEWGEKSRPPFTPPPEPTPHTRTTPTLANSDFTPTPSHGPMPTDCMNYHQAEPNESCRDILETYNYLTKEQFFKYNPVLKNNCDGLWEGNWYCIGVKSEIPMPPTVTVTPSDVPSGSPKDCKAWYYTTGGETCDDLAMWFGTFSAESFIAMNPSVLEDCSDITDDTWYCVAGPDTPTTRTADPITPVQAPTAMPTQSGLTPKCKDFWLVGKTETCRFIRRANSISLEQLIEWNPALGSKCQGLKMDSYICVGV